MGSNFLGDESTPSKLNEAEHILHGIMLFWEPEMEWKWANGLMEKPAGILSMVNSLDAQQLKRKSYILISIFWGAGRVRKWSRVLMVAMIITTTILPL